MVEEEWALTVEVFLIAYMFRKEEPAGTDAPVKTGEKYREFKCS